MARKILTYTLIGLSTLFLVLSLVGIIAAWAYNTPLTENATAQLEDVDSQLSQIQTDLRSARDEVERALRIIASVEEGLASLTQQTQDISQMIEEVNQTLDDELLPGLANTRTNLIEIRTVLEDLRSSIELLNRIPFVNLQIPGDELIVNLLEGVDSFDSQIGLIQTLAQQASVFINDSAHVLGDDFQETKQYLQDLLIILDGYDIKLSNWREQIKTLIESTPKWIDNTSISLTVFLLWFALSQFGLLLHGLSLRLGEDPLDIWRETFRK